MMKDVPVHQSQRPEGIMRIFLTGATGYIGSAVLDALVRAGHQVTCLVRSAEKAAATSQRGGRPIVSDLGTPASYQEAAAGHDGYIHVAFESSARGPEVDRIAVETLLAAARRDAPAGAGKDRFFVFTSGPWVLGSTRQPAAEDAPVNPTEIVAWRPAREQTVLSAGGSGLRTCVVRPGIVCGGARGIIGDLIRDASNGLIRIVGNGENHWPVVYDRDLADLYVRLAVRPEASGIYHATDESDERVNDIVGAIAAQMKTYPQIRRMPLEEARAKMGAYAAALALDQIVLSPRARALGWSPTLRSITGNAAALLEEWRSGQA
jgi:nucleoside-diphosphate-sugar epimerase